MFDSPTYFWLTVMVILLIIEAIVPGLVSIWFAAGSLFAVIASAIGAPVWLQILIFISISLLSLILTRPLVKKYINSRTEHTNADAAIGKECIVTSPVDNIAGTGSAKVDGKEWTARSTDDKVLFEKNEHAIVSSIEGVKLMLEKVSYK